MLIKNHVQLLEKIYKRKDGIPDAYRVDEIDVDSYFFYNFLDVFLKQQNHPILKDLNMRPSPSKNSSMITSMIRVFEYDSSMIMTT